MPVARLGRSLALQPRPCLSIGRETTTFESQSAKMAYKELLGVFGNLETVPSYEDSILHRRSNARYRLIDRSTIVGA
jgi:hypothetical protein